MSTTAPRGGRPDAAHHQQLRVQADLTLEVDGTTAHLMSQGSRLTLVSSHPERLWTSALAAALPAGVGDLDGPRAIGRAADGLAEAGLRLEVTGPQGIVAELGDGVSSRIGRLITGSSAVGPGTPRALGVLLWRRTGPTVGALALAVGGAAIAVAVLHRRPRAAKPLQH